MSLRARLRKLEQIVSERRVRETADTAVLLALMDALTDWKDIPLAERYPHLSSAQIAMAESSLNG